VRKRSHPILCLALGLLTAGAAAADTIVFQEGGLLPGGGTYTGTQDTEIAGASPASSFGGLETFRSDQLDPTTGGAEVQGLLQFDALFGALPGQIPFGATINSAVITLFAPNASSSPTGNIAIYQMTTAWDESSTWDSLTNGVQIGSETLASPDDSINILFANTQGNFDVLASLQAWLGGDTNFGWVIINDSTDGVVFSSKDSTTAANRPMLTVDFTPIPEPGSLLLAGLAATAALCVRRSRVSR
jgi:hypothetical protein